MKVKTDSLNLFQLNFSLHKLVCYLGESKKRCHKEGSSAVKYHKNKMQDDSNEEEFVNNELVSPPENSTVKQEAKGTDSDKDEGSVNDDMDPPEKVHINVE